MWIIQAYQKKIQLDLIQIVAARGHVWRFSVIFKKKCIAFLKQLVITLVTHNPDHAKLDSKLLRF